MAKLNSAEKKVLNEVAAWKGAAPSFLNRATDIVSRPITWLTERIIPQNIREASGGVADGIADKLRDISQFTVNRQDVLKATREYQIDSETVLELRKANIFDLDNVAGEFIDNNTKMATVGGAGTGLVGWPGLIADLPALFMLSTRTINQVALCYGFDAADEDLSPSERQFEIEYMMRVFKIATAPDMVQKQRGLSELKDLEAGRLLDEEDELGGDFAARQVSKNATSLVSQRLIREIVEQTVSKKAAALVPGLGAIFSAGFNYVYLRDVGEAAFMLYRERFLLDKMGRRRVINVDID